MPSFETPFAGLEVPGSLPGQLIQTPTQHRALAILRGDLAPGRPAVVVLTLRDFLGATFDELVEELVDSLGVDAGAAVPLSVSGADHACRIDARVELERGIAGGDAERLCVVVAAAGRDCVVLNIRTAPEHDTAAAVDRMVASFRIYSG